MSRLQRQTSGVQDEQPDLFEDTGLRQQHVLAMEEAESVSINHISITISLHRTYVHDESITDLILFLRLGSQRAWR